MCTPSSFVYCTLTLFSTSNYCIEVRALILILTALNRTWILNRRCDEVHFLQLEAVEVILFLNKDLLTLKNQNVKID